MIAWHGVPVDEGGSRVCAEAELRKAFAACAWLDAAS